MKVKDLIEALADVDPESDIILQKDPEGNGFSTLSDADSNAVYIAESTYSGTVYSLEWNADDADMTDEEWAKIKTKPKCVVLCPVN